MNWSAPEKVLITGGRELGGVSSFAEGLSSGFSELGIEAEIIAPTAIWKRWRELRDARVLKVLSTTGVFAVPFSRRSICVAHGTTSVRDQGWGRAFLIRLSYKLASVSPKTCLVAVSDYVAAHLDTIFDIRVVATIRNPLSGLFLEPAPQDAGERIYVTFVGRLVPCKRVDRLIPPIKALLNEYSQLRCCIVGDGPCKATLERMVGDDPRFELVGTQDQFFVREQLRRTKLFVSGTPNEALGIAYLEALSQGCAVAMPASGGGLEIAPEKIGDTIQLLPISLEHQQVLATLRHALTVEHSPVCMSSFYPESVASAYLGLDRLLSRNTERYQPVGENRNTDAVRDQ
jgi:glycosyltransferase involved in cell wall biosynthesis